jgi:hypothetical protein
MRWANMGEENEVYKLLMRMPKGNKALGRRRRRWEDGIRMILGRLSEGGVDSIVSG